MTGVILTAAAIIVLIVAAVSRSLDRARFRDLSIRPDSIVFSVDKKTRVKRIL